MTQTLSLCMIVKDEEKYLQDCLESAKNIVDQIIIIDTGSRDKTVEIAEKFCAEIYKFNWCDNFSSARNESIKYATSDWILWMDADERLRSDSGDKFKKILKPETKPVIYKVQINSITDNGSNVRLSSAHRLFNNNQGISFTGKIHEQVSESAAKLGGEERESGIIIDHLGYDLAGEEQVKKNKRNLKLLERMAKESPNSAYANYTLAQQYAMIGENENALKYYNIAHNLNQFDKQMKVSLLNTMAEVYLKTGNLEKANSLSHDSIKLESMQVGGYYLLYRIADEKNNYSEAIEWLEKLLENNRRLENRLKTISTDVLINENRILYTLGKLYQKSKNYEKALNTLQKFDEQEPQRIEGKERLTEILIETGNFSEAEKYLKMLIEKLPQNEQYCEVYGTVLIKQEKYHEAISHYESLFQVNPNNSNILKRLVGLYAKTGEIERANKLIGLIT